MLDDRTAMSNHILLGVVGGILALVLLGFDLLWSQEAACLGAAAFAVLLWRTRDVLSWKVGALSMTLGAVAFTAAVWIGNSRGLSLAELNEVTSLPRATRRLPFVAVMLMSFGALSLAGSVLQAFRKRKSQGPRSVV